MKLGDSRTLLTVLSLLSVINPALSQDHGEEAATEMGPVAFMWPPDREWGAAQDNRAPCGSSQGVVNRTEFPLGMFRPFLVSKPPLLTGVLSQRASRTCHARGSMARHGIGGLH